MLFVDKSTCTKLLPNDHSTADVKIQTNGCPSPALYPVGRRGHTAVLYRNSMYIYGGYVDMKGSSAELWQFNFGISCLHCSNYLCMCFEFTSEVLGRSDWAHLLARSELRSYFHHLWTNVHQIKFACVGVSIVCNAFFRLMISC